MIMKYSLGLDIGTSSVGWAMLDLDKQRIHDLGVRIFERPEDPRDGDSLAKPRRNARSARRRLKRRRQRLNNLKRFFVEQKLLTQTQVEQVLNPESAYNKLDVYKLRKQAIDEELSAEELLKVLYQIAKRRGFKSNRKIEEESDKEGGRVSQALKHNQKFLVDKKYATVGVALSDDSQFQAHKRNKRDDYTNSFAREDFMRELEQIIAKQQQFVLKGIPRSAINELIYGLDEHNNLLNQSAIMYQRPFMTEKLIQRMVGQCTFEPQEKRAPRASYSFELFRLANDLKNLVFIPKNASSRHHQDMITLSSEQIQKVIATAKTQKSLTYKKVRQVAGVDENYVPAYVRGKKKDEFGETNDFGGLKAYQAIKTVFKNLPDEWRKIDNEAAINQIAYILTVQKTDNEIMTALSQSTLGLSEAGRQALLKVNTNIKTRKNQNKSDFKTFAHLSITALQKITPHILAGETYDKACELAGYDFRKQALNLDQITNPVVKRAISQTRKVVQAIERKYGQPYFIKVETARDLAKDFKERKAIENENKENQANNQKIIDQLQNEFNVTSPTGHQITKMKLYREQNGKCLYSGKSIDVATMLADDNAYQIDHIVPFSRSNNDGLTNKVLVLTEENQRKANRTPFEYFGHDEKCWQEFVARVEATYDSRDVKTADKQANRQNYKYNGYALKKKYNLLIQDYKNDEWNVRALNDTRHTTRFVQNYLKQTVKFADGPEKQRVFTPNGVTTAYLRKRWGLNKVRATDVLHHAADAAIVAAVDQAMIQQANLYAKRGEIRNLLSSARTLEEQTNQLTGEILNEDEFAKAQRIKNAQIVLSSKHFPEPWPNFAKEIRKRTLNVSRQDLQNELRGLDNYDEVFRLSVKPIFVSRMARHKVTGSAHKETIRSPKVIDGDQRTVRMPIAKLTRKDIENSKLKQSDKWLYNELLRRLDATQHAGKDRPKLAFAESIYKNNKRFDKGGRPLSPVRAIKVYSTRPSGFYVNKGRGFVNNGSMVRLDVYRKVSAKGKVEHFFVPVYVHQIGKNKPTPTKILPAPKGFTDIDDSFTELGSLYPNDYVKIDFGDRQVEGYYVKYGSASGQIILIPHCVAGKNNDTYITCSARSAQTISSSVVSILGDNILE